MKKAGIRRIVNFILCVSLFANILSGQVMAMNSEAQMEASPQEALESLNEAEEPTGEQLEENDEEQPEEEAEEKPEDSPQTSPIQSPEASPTQSPEAAPSQSPTATPTQKPEDSSTMDEKQEQEENEAGKEEVLEFLRGMDGYADKSEEELLVFIDEVRYALSVNDYLELLACLEEIRNEIYADIADSEGMSDEEKAAYFAEEFEKRLQKRKEDIAKDNENGDEKQEEQTYLPKLKELLITIPAYADMQEEELQQVIEELLTKGEFQTKQALYEFLEEESTTEEFMQELTQKILDGCITENFRKIVEIVRMVQDYSASDILEIRGFVDEILLRCEVEDGEVLLMLEEELPYIYEELEELEGYEDMTDEEKQLYVSKALKMLLESLLNTEIELLNVSGNINLSQYNNGGEIVLDADTTASSVCQLSSGTLTIDLKGHTLTMANGAYFMLNGDKAVINIKDSAGGGIIYASRQLIWGYNGGTINLYGGTLDGSKVTSAGQLGGCIQLGRSNIGNHTFNMYGGCIRNFKATQYGGAVYVGDMFSGKKNIFNMYGGTIEDCYAPAGSAVYIDDSGDGPGYFYLKGGTKQSEGGEPKATIRCLDGPNAIYNYGYLGMEGVVDIDGIVYLNQNNWASTTTHFIKIIGRLVVVGDGYIDIDSAYPNSNAVCPGHTVVENVTQTEGIGSVTISQEEFYTYSSYFINTTKGLMVSAGFDPGQNELDGNDAPANWPKYQSDKYNQKYSYVDVMGQELLIQSSDSPGPKRQKQNYNYLIYVERANPTDPYKEYYSVKLLKTDLETQEALNGAEFQLVRTHDAEGNELDSSEIIGYSAATGDLSKGLDQGVTYLYLPGYDGKLMIEDGIYELKETNAPGGDYVCRDHVVSLHIYHKISEESGKEVSVVEVRANGKILSVQEQEINSTYHDKGWMVEREIVLNINNTNTVIDEKTDYKVRVEKYADAEYTIPLAGAVFEIQTTEETAVKKASCITDENGQGSFLDENGSEFTFSNGEQFLFAEITAPEEYFLMNEKIQLKVDEDGQVWINNTILTNGKSVGSGEESANPEHGTWKVSFNEDMLAFQVYDEKMPPTWKLQAIKYGTKKIDALRLPGVKFTLLRIDADGETSSETEVVSVTSSDGTDGQKIGDIAFLDENGQMLELSCNATYLLRETYAPMGYTLIGDIRIEVNEDGSVVTVTKDGEPYTGTSYDAANRVLTLSIVDETVYQMPETGKRGIYPLLFYSVILLYGSLMIGFFLFGKNRHNENKE